MDNKSKEVGHGGYGCVYKPPLECKESHSPEYYKGKITKASIEKHAKDEIDKQKLIDEIDPSFKYHLRTPKICTPAESNEELLKECKPIKTNIRKHLKSSSKLLDNVRLLTIDDGGMDFTRFTDTIHHIYANESKIKSMKILTTFWSKSFILIDAIEDFLTKRIMHRDLKPENIMYNIDDERFNIIDFGLLTTFDSYITSFHYNYPPETYFTDDAAVRKIKKLSDNEIKKMLGINVPFNTGTKFMDMYTYVLNDISIHHGADEAYSKYQILDKYAIVELIDVSKFKDSYFKMRDITLKTHDIYGLGEALMYVFVHTYRYLAASTSTAQIIPDKNKMFIKKMYKLLFSMVHPDYTKRRTINGLKDDYITVLKLLDIDVEGIFQLYFSDSGMTWGQFTNEILNKPIQKLDSSTQDIIKEYLTNVLKINDINTNKSNIDELFEYIKKKGGSLQTLYGILSNTQSLNQFLYGYMTAHGMDENKAIVYNSQEMPSESKESSKTASKLPSNETKLPSNETSSASKEKAPEDFQTEIERLKNILNNPSYTVFNSACVRKKTNWSKLARKYKFDNIDFDPNQLLTDLPIVSPKLNKLLKNIAELDQADMRKHGRLFKHFIFSDIKGFQGAKVITSSLIAKGLNLAYTASVEITDGMAVDYGKIELKSNKELLKTRSKNFYFLSSVGVFDQPISVSIKKEILANFNSRPDNVYGDIARIIVMDSGFKEGIDLFDIKYIHIFEPQTTAADQKQVIGRGTRTCGQKGLVFHPTMGWPLYVFNYDIEINERFQHSFNYSKSAFDLYLKTLNIDLRLFNFLTELENAVILGSVDYELNINIHNFTISTSQKSNSKDSVYSSAKAISSLKSGDLIRGGGVPFPDTPLGFEETREFIRTYFSQYSWDDVHMENLCGYAGPSLGKGKLPPNPLSSKKSQSSTISDIIEPLSANKTPSKNSKTSGLMDVNQIPNGSNPASPATSAPHLYSPHTPLSSPPPTPIGIGNTFPIIKDTSTDLLKEVRLYDGQPPSRLISRGGGDGSNGGDLMEVNMNGISGISGIGGMMFGGASSIVKLSPSQAFIRSYFTPETPQKGVLLNWSVGTGKTCAAIATATSSFENAGYTILWVTRTTLKNDIWKNMFDQVCSDKIREIIENAKETGKSIPTDQTERMRLLSNSWSIQPMSYRQFSNLVSKRNSLYKTLVNKNGTRDPLHKTLLIIDEAHKLYGGNDLSSIERPDMNALHKALMNSYIVSGKESVRVLLMTATPITVNPMELIKLLNLCRPSDNQLPEEFGNFAEKFSLTNDGTFTDEGKSKFLDEISGYISYLNREKDARQFAQPIIEQVAVPLVENEDLQALIDKYDIPKTENVDSEEYKLAMSLQDELEKQTKTLGEWASVSDKAKFKPLLEKCDGLQKDIKKECIKSVKEDINEILATAKNESTILKEQIKKIRTDLKEMNSVKTTKIREIRNNINNAEEDYDQFKVSVYNNLKNVCSKKIKDIKTLKDATEELPEIIEINRLIKEVEDNIKQLQIDLKNKIESFKHHIAVLKEETKKPQLSTEEKKNMKALLIREEKRVSDETKKETYRINGLTKKLNKTKKSFETDKKKLLQKLKKSYKKDLSTKKKEYKKTLKLKDKLNNLDVEHETEQLKTLIANKKTKIAEDIERFYLKHREDEENKEAEKRDKQIRNEQLKKQKEEEKAKKDAEKAEQKVEQKMKKEEEKAKKDAEKAEQKKKKEEEKAKKDAEKAEQKAEQKKKKDEEKKNKTRKLHSK